MLSRAFLEWLLLMLEAEGIEPEPDDAPEPEQHIVLVPRIGGVVTTAGFQPRNALSNPRPTQPALSITHNGDLWALGSGRRHSPQPLEPARSTPVPNPHILYAPVNRAGTWGYGLARRLNRDTSPEGEWLLGDFQPTLVRELGGSLLWLGEGEGSSGLLTRKWRNTLTTSFRLPSIPESMFRRPNFPVAGDGVSNSVPYRAKDPLEFGRGFFDAVPYGFPDNRYTILSTGVSSILEKAEVFFTLSNTKIEAAIDNQSLNGSSNSAQIGYVLLYEIFAGFPSMGVTTYRNVDGNQRDTRAWVGDPFVHNPDQWHLLGNEVIAYDAIGRVHVWKDTFLAVEVDMPGRSFRLALGGGVSPDPHDFDTVTEAEFFPPSSQPLPQSRRFLLHSIVIPETLEVVLSDQTEVPWHTSVLPRGRLFRLHSAGNVALIVRDAFVHPDGYSYPSKTWGHPANRNIPARWQQATGRETEVLAWNVLTGQTIATFDLAAELELDLEHEMTVLSYNRQPNGDYLLNFWHPDEAQRINAFFGIDYAPDEGIIFRSGRTFPQSATLDSLYQTGIPDGADRLTGAPVVRGVVVR